MIGHGVGQPVAACLAGTVSLDDALGLVATENISVPTSTDEILPEEPGRIFLELGPGRGASASLARALQTLGQLWLAGFTIDWTSFAAGEQRRRVPLPGYPFERQRYWIDVPGTSAVARVVGRSEPLVKQADLASWFYVPEWTKKPLAAAGEDDASAWLILTDQAGLGAKLAESLGRRGHTVVCAESFGAL